MSAYSVYFKRPSQFLLAYSLAAASSVAISAFSRRQSCFCMASWLSSSHFLVHVVLQSAPWADAFLISLIPYTEPTRIEIVTTTRIVIVVFSMYLMENYLPYQQFVILYYDMFLNNVLKNT